MKVRDQIPQQAVQEHLQRRMVQEQGRPLSEKSWNQRIITASGAGEAEESDSFVDAVVCTEVQMMAKTL